MAMRECPLDGDSLSDITDDDAALDESPQPVDEIGRHFGQIGERFSSDAFSFAPCSPEEDGWR